MIARLLDMLDALSELMLLWVAVAMVFFVPLWLLLTLILVVMGGWR